MLASPASTSCAQAQRGIPLDPLAAARQGDPDALAWLLNQSLQAFGFQIRVWRHPEREVRILIEAEHLPDSTEWMIFLDKGLQRLQPSGIDRIRVYGRPLGVGVMAWTEEIDLSPQPPLQDLEPLEDTAGSTARDRKTLEDPNLSSPAAIEDRSRRAEADPPPQLTPSPSWDSSRSLPKIPKIPKIPRISSLSRILKIPIPWTPSVLVLWGCGLILPLVWLARLQFVNLGGANPNLTAVTHVASRSSVQASESQGSSESDPLQAQVTRSVPIRRAMVVSPTPIQPKPVDMVTIAGSEDTLTPACEAAQTGPYFQFLGDACHQKRYPSLQDRDHICPVIDPTHRWILPSGEVIDYAPAQPDLNQIPIDTTQLSHILPPELNITVILIKRVNGIPHYRYLSNGTQAQTFQPWSASKFMAVANAASTIRIQSNYQVSLLASVDGFALGDLITSLHQYSYQPYSSNRIGRYFQTIGGPEQANNLIHDQWLQRPEVESFGGGYGEADAPLSYQLIDPSGTQLLLQPPGGQILPNHLSSFTLAEFLKRLVMHREDPHTRLPGIQWSDLKILFYGAPPHEISGMGDSELGFAGSGDTDAEDPERGNLEKHEDPFPDVVPVGWGGMAADLSLYLQTHEMDDLEARSQGQWLTFSKMGFGKGSFVSVGYACFPWLDSQQRPIPGAGREFVIAAQLAQGGSSWRERDRLFAQYHRMVIHKILTGEVL